MGQNCLCYCGVEGSVFEVYLKGLLHQTLKTNLKDIPRLGALAQFICVRSGGSSWIDQDGELELISNVLYMSFTMRGVLTHRIVGIRHVF